MAFCFIMENDIVTYFSKLTRYKSALNIQIYNAKHINEKAT